MSQLSREHISILREITVLQGSSFHTYHRAKENVDGIKCLIANFATEDETASSPKT